MIPNSFKNTPRNSLPPPFQAGKPISAAQMNRLRENVAAALRGNNSAPIPFVGFPAIITAVTEDAGAGRYIYDFQQAVNIPGDYADWQAMTGGIVGKAFNFAEDGGGATALEVDAVVFIQWFQIGSDYKTKFWFTAGGSGGSATLPTGEYVGQVYSTTGTNSANFSFLKLHSIP